MNKIKNFFFNKIEKNKTTNFYDLVTSFVLGGVKIFILLMLNLIVGSFIFTNGFENEYMLLFSILSSLITLSILIYILVNRIPNQIKVFKNYLNNNFNKNQGVKKVDFPEKVIKSENLNFDDFKERIYFKNGKKKVYYTFDQLKIKGNLYTNDLIWFEDLKNWTKVSEIDELSSIALSEPPLTQKEKNILCFKKSLKPSIIFYIFFSIFIGIFSALLEKEQYKYFMYEINKNIESLKKDGLYTVNSNNSYKENSFESYSEMRPSEIYVTNEDGTKFTRWSYTLPTRGTDQEQISYNKSYNFLFRPYKAIIEHANLSIEERENTWILLSNFTYSTLITNFLLLPFLILAYFFKNKKRICLE